MKNRIPVLTVIIVMIGFASGINYVSLLQTVSFSSIESCLEFGLASLALGEAFFKVLGKTFISFIKHIFIMSFGLLFKALFAVTLFDLFALSFKFGVSAAYFYSLIKLNFTPSVIIAASTLLFFVYFCEKVIWIKLQNRGRFSIDEALELKRGSLLLLATAVINVLCSLLVIASNGKFYGVAVSII